MEHVECCNEGRGMHYAYVLCTVADIPGSAKRAKNILNLFNGVICVGLM